MAGDLFYLTVRTLENPQAEHGITCSVNGFYRNDNVERQNFQPLPSQRNTPCYSYTLVGCLNQISAQFGRNLQTYLTSIIRTEPYFITPITHKVESWITSDDSRPIRVSNLDGISQTAAPLHGFDPKINREWNEEFQVLRLSSSDNFLLRI